MKQLLRAIPLMSALLLAEGRVQAADSAAETFEGFSPAEVKELLEFEQPTWAFSSSATVSAGYNDNLMLSYADPERSAFVRGTVEALVWRVPTHGFDFVGFVNAQASQYFEGETMDQDAQAFAGLEFRYRIPDRLEAALEAQGFYLDQVFDVSDSEVRRLFAKLELSGITVGPRLRWSFASWLWLEGAAGATRERYRDAGNDARVREGEVTLGIVPHARIELRLSAMERRREYDRRVQYTLSGRPSFGLLATRERVLESLVQVVWGRRERWKTLSRAGRTDLFDNGSGFFNHRTDHVGQEIEWSDGKWTVRADAEARFRDYVYQEIGIGIVLDPLFRDEFAASLAVERRLSARWTALAEYRWERSRSNDVFARYRLNEGLLGLRWNWDK